MRLIDADALEKSICQDKCEAEECGMTFERDGAEYCLEVQRVKDAPTIDATPIKHGRNIYYTAKGHCEFKCSICGAEAHVVEGGELDGGYFNYCPSCGAKMEEEN